MNGEWGEFLVANFVLSDPFSDFRPEQKVRAQRLPMFCRVTVQIARMAFETWTSARIVKTLSRLHQVCTKFNWINTDRRARTRG